MSEVLIKPGCLASHQGPGEEPELGPLGSASSEFCLHRRHLRDFLESLFLGEEVKIIKKKGDHLPNLCKDHPPEQLGASRANSWYHGSCLQPLGRFLTALAPSPKLQAKWKQESFLQGKKNVTGVQQIQVSLFETSWNFLPKYF